jgi:hypothetical protein
MDEALDDLGTRLRDAISNRNIGARPRHMSGMQHTPEPSIARTPKKHRRLIGVGVAVGALVLCGGVAAAAISKLSNDTVEHGLPGGSAIFEGTTPNCTTTDNEVFDCTLTSAPTIETLDDYTGSAQLFVDDAKYIAGGCRGQSADGLKWICYVGDLAVQQGILSADLLGQYSPEPSHG